MTNTAEQLLDETLRKFGLKTDENAEAFTDDAVIADLGVDSLDLLEVVMEIESRTGKYFDEDNSAPKKDDTFGALKAWLQEKIDG